MDKYPLTTIAALLGCTAPDLQKVLRDKKLFNDLADEYDLVTPIQAYVAHLREKTAEGQKAIQEKVKTDLMTFELERKKGAFVPVNEVQTTVKNLNDAWIAAFGFLPKEDLNKGIRAFAKTLSN
jgi:hypothetical protein